MSPSNKIWINLFILRNFKAIRNILIFISLVIILAIISPTYFQRFTMFFSPLVQINRIILLQLKSLWHILVLLSFEIVFVIYSPTQLQRLTSNVFLIHIIIETIFIINIMDLKIGKIYKLQCKIGSGSFGEIYSAININTNEEVWNI
jgi:hypothetical protein